MVCYVKVQTVSVDSYEKDMNLWAVCALTLYYATVTGKSPRSGDEKDKNCDIYV